MATRPATKRKDEYRIRVFRPAFASARRLFPRVQDWMELRAQTLKLRWWPGGQGPSKVVDINWDWIKSLPSLNVGELRIDDAIGGRDNLRVIFFKPDIGGMNYPNVIWVLEVLQKKRQEFTQNDIRSFKARRALVLERFYGGAMAG